MDRAQGELQTLGFFGIFKESFKIISKWKKIFSQITLALILPLSFISLAQMQISTDIGGTKVGTSSYTKRSHQISLGGTAYWLLEALFFTLMLILSLVSTSAVAYTIACIYSAKEITFKKVMSVVPKVWKRLLVTFLWNFAIFFVYNIVAIVLLILPILFIGFVPIGVVILVVLVILYLVGLVYLSIVWSLASVVSVLEDVKGIKAMIKSKALIKGKMGAAIAFFFLLAICFLVVASIYENIVVIGFVSDVGIRIGTGILCFLLLIPFILISLVSQTIIYFVCKSYHHENIDESSLANHLEAKDVQLEQSPV